MSTTIRASTGRADASGYIVFGDGRLGALHVFAHRCHDEGELGLGARALHMFLAGARRSNDPRVVHLHWHLAVMEVLLGRWSSSRTRLLRRVLPAVPGGTARTDGPSGLWYLSLFAPRPVALPWTSVAKVARAHLGEARTWLAAHDALALAGARDVAALDAWLAHRNTGEAGVLLLLGRGLRAFAAGDEWEAARWLSRARPKLADLGGSWAQRTLFERIASGALPPGMTTTGHPWSAPSGSTALHIRA